MHLGVIYRCQWIVVYHPPWLACSVQIFSSDHKRTSLVRPLLFHNQLLLAGLSIIAYRQYNPQVHWKRHDFSSWIVGILLFKTGYIENRYSGADRPYCQTENNARENNFSLSKLISLSSFARMATSLSLLFLRGASVHSFCFFDCLLKLQIIYYFYNLLYSIYVMAYLPQ